MIAFDRLSEALKVAGVKHFSAAELLRIKHPDIARRVGITTAFFTPTKKQVDELVKVALLAEVVRERFGGPLTVLNGLRPRAYNDQVTKAKNSQHIYGRALDLAVASDNMQRLRDIVETMWHAGEIGGVGLYRNNVHIDTRQTQAIWGSMVNRTKLHG